jgi:23S rRNA (uracil1939-C5)-methyltransferase
MGIAKSASDALNALASANGLPAVRLHEGHAPGYRHRARLAVRGRAKAPKIGIFREGTHEIVDIPHCPIHHPLINEIAREIKAELKVLEAPPYSDSAHAGLVRYLQIVVERSSQQAQLVLVTCSDQYDANAALCQALEKRLGARLQGFAWNGNPDHHNAILGPHWHPVMGNEATVEQIGGAQAFFPPGAFGQSHLGLYDTIVERVHSWARGATRVVELYAGTGGLGLGLVQQGAHVTFNELESASLTGLRMGIAALSPDLQTRTAVVPGTAGDVASTLCSTDAELVLADPPRKGLDAGVLAALVSNRPKHFIYLSCGLDSFLRDTAALLSDAYALKSLEAYAMFPFTEHVESLALFEAR